MAEGSGSKPQATWRAFGQTGGRFVGGLLSPYSVVIASFCPQACAFCLLPSAFCLVSTSANLSFLSNATRNLQNPSAPVPRELPQPGVHPHLRLRPHDRPGLLRRVAAHEVPRPPTRLRRRSLR